MRKPDNPHQRLLDIYANRGIVSDTFGTRVRRVVFVVCSPRSGSSLLASILRSTDQLLSLQGAVTPFLALEALTYPHSTGSESLDERHMACVGHLSRHLEFECGTASIELPDDNAIEDFGLALAVRLTCQWPDLNIEPTLVRQEVFKTLRLLQHKHGWNSHSFEDKELFHLLFLLAMRRHYPQINPYLYDIPPDLIRLHAKDLDSAALAPRDDFLEMPPFILISPWQRATSEELSSKTFVMKTVGNSFRLPFWKAFFPNAEFRVLHLTRNVAASANGMLDGWHHDGFWCARTETELNIPEYSDTYPDWGRHWWKFGLFPGWEQYSQSPVIEIAAAHWRTCHQTILAWLEQHPEISRNALRIHFEELVGTREERHRTFDNLVEWLDIALDAPLAYARDNTMPLQLSTKKPAPHRWREREQLLQPVTRDPENIALMEQLGYSLETSTWR